MLLFSPMNPEDRQLLEEALKLSRENNQILLKMERAARWSTVWTWIKIAFVVLPLIIGYLYLEPFLNQITGGSQSAKGNLEQLVGTYQDLLKN